MWAAEGTEYEGAPDGGQEVCRGASIHRVSPERYNGLWRRVGCGPVTAWGRLGRVDHRSVLRGTYLYNGRREGVGKGG